MYIYRVKNARVNYTKGYWYFTAKSDEKVKKIIASFEKQFNHKKNDSYTVALDLTKVVRFGPIEDSEGYLPLNGSTYALVSDLTK